MKAKTFSINLSLEEQKDESRCVPKTAYQNLKDQSLWYSAKLITWFLVTYIIFSTISKSWILEVQEIVMKYGRASKQRSSARL